MIIERTSKEVIIRIPSNVDVTDLQEMIDFIYYKEITSKSQAKQSEIDEFLNSFKKGRHSKILSKTTK